MPMPVPPPVPPASAAPRHADPRVCALVSLFEGLSPADLPGLRGVYAADARFKDPFNDVVGVPAIEHIFAHMFSRLEQPRFIVTEQTPSMSLLPS